MNEETRKILKLAGILWIILVIPFILVTSWMGVISQLNLFPAMMWAFILLIIFSLAYFGLWLIPSKYPSIKPLFFSSTIGLVISFLFIPLSFIIYWLLVVRGVYNPDALIWIGLLLILYPGVIIIMAVSIIIGIVKSVKEWKKIKSK